MCIKRICHQKVVPVYYLNTYSSKKNPYLMHFKKNYCNKKIKVAISYILERTIMFTVTTLTDYFLSTRYVSV